MKTPDCRSIFTVLIYLNDNFEGESESAMTTNPITYRRNPDLPACLCLSTFVPAIFPPSPPACLPRYGATRPPSLAGGETQFWDSSEKDSPVTTVVPEAGMCLVFNHDWLHGGLALREGPVHNLKYIIRTDVMFIRSVSPLLCARTQGQIVVRP